MSQINVLLSGLIHVSLVKILQLVNLHSVVCGGGMVVAIKISMQPCLFRFSNT